MMVGPTFYRYPSSCCNYSIVLYDQGIYLSQNPYSLMTPKKAFGLFLSAFILFQCSDDNDTPPEPPKDTDSPVVTITAPAAGGTVFGTIKLSATSKDNDGVVKMQIFIDNATTASAESTTDAIALDFDTTPLNDGTHTVKFVAVDKAGNSGEESVTLAVANTLLTFSVPADYFETDLYDYWILLSDEKGTLLDFKELQNSSTYVYRATKDYAATGITMNLLVYSNFSPRALASVSSYPNIPYGAYQYAVTPPSTYPPTVGSGSVTISDAPDQNFLSQYKFTAPGGLYVSSTQYTSDFGFYMRFQTSFDKSAFMLSRIAGGGMTYLYKEVTQASDYTYSMADFIQADTKTISVPAAGNYSVTVTGYNDYGSYGYTGGQSFSAAGSVLKVPYPANVFTSYGISISNIVAGEGYGSYFRGNDLPASLTPLNASISARKNGATLAVNASGNVDFAILLATYSVTDLDINWRVYAPGGNQTFVLPDMPQELIDRYKLRNYKDLNQSYSYVYDYAELNGYTDYLARRMKIDTLVAFKDYSFLQVR